MRKRNVNKHEWLTANLSEGFKPTACNAVDIRKQKVTRVRNECSLYYSLAKWLQIKQSGHSTGVVRQKPRWLKYVEVTHRAQMRPIQEAKHLLDRLVFQKEKSAQWERSVSSQHGNEKIV